MPKLPVLKPHEVVAASKSWDLSKSDNVVPTSNSDIPMVEARPYPSTRGVISPILLRQIARDIGLTAEELVGVNG